MKRCVDLRYTPAVRVAPLVIGICLSAGSLYAQQATQTQDQHQPLLLPAVQYGSPMRASGGLAVFLPTAEGGTFRRRGFIVEGDVGQSGAKLSFGPSSILEYMEVDARGVLYRTWGSPLRAATHATYAGAEAGIMIAYVRASVGVAHRVAGPSGPRATILSWNAGLQFPF